jgi:hypothetical protein
VKNLKERFFSGDERIILKQILKKENVKAQTGCRWLRIGSCEHGHESLSDVRQKNP